jgi:diacylglycerol kinase (ATP)
MMIRQPAVATEYIDLPSPPAAPRDWLILVNPASGCHRPGQRWEIIRRLQRELATEVVITRSYAHIAELLGAAGGPRGVAVFGGDGTIAQVVNHMDLDAQRLLLLPGGTGNGLARDLGITSVDRALAALRANALGTIDLLQVTLCTPQAQIRRLVVSTSSLGYTAETVALAGRIPRALGALRYTLASLMQAARMSARPMAVTINGDAPQELRLTNVVVNNTRHVGNFCGFRGASLRDGRCDVMLADNRFWPQVLQNIGLLTRTYVCWRGRELSARSVHLRSPAPLQLMLDGEIWDDVCEVSFAVLPGRLRCYWA